MNLINTTNIESHALKQGTQESKGDMARLQSFVGAIAIGDMVRSTLGPKGMDKILQPMSQNPTGNIQVTNDGATILKATYLDNAAARILVEISMSQDDQVGDGTTTVAVFASELLKEAEKLYNSKIHPQLIIEGYKAAKAEALRTLEDIAFENNDEEIFKGQLLNIAKTTLSSKLLTQQKERFAKIAVDAVLRLKGNDDLNLIKIIRKQGNSLNDSFLADGFILEKSISVGCPKIKNQAKVLIANTPMDNDKIKIQGARVQTDSLVTLGNIEKAEKDKMRSKVDKILAYKPDVFINRQLVQNYPEQLFAEAGVMCIEHADFDGIERLSAVTGGDILSTFNEPDSYGNKLGQVENVSEIIVGEDKMIQFKGCKANGACTIVLRGANTHILEEAERSLHDALCVLSQAVKNTKFIYGGGNSEINCYKRVKDLAAREHGKKALAIEGQANALKQLPMIVCENAGLDASELIQDLRSEIVNGNKSAGVDVNIGKIACMKTLGIMECMKVKQTAISSASEAAEQILRVDDIIKQAPRQREQ